MVSVIYLYKTEFFIRRLMQILLFRIESRDSNGFDERIAGRMTWGGPAARFLTISDVLLARNQNIYRNSIRRELTDEILMISIVWITVGIFSRRDLVKFK